MAVLNEAAAVVAELWQTIIKGYFWSKGYGPFLI